MDNTTNTCLVCGDATSNGDKHAEYPYCRSCHYNGKAYTHLWAEVVEAVKAAGFPCEVWQTGGGCQNLAVAFTEGGFAGPHAMMGSLGLTLAESEHPEATSFAHDGDGYPCFEYHDCHACKAYVEIEFAANRLARSTEFTTMAEYAAWVVATAKAFAAAIPTLPDHAE